EALSGLFKYRSPVPDSLGMYYVGILWLPFRQCMFQLNVEANEAQPTGTREAAVMIIAGDSWPNQQAEPIPVANWQEAQEKSRAAAVYQLPSDDAQYDRIFPDHPLSLVRVRLTEVISTARFDPNAKNLGSFRVGQLGV